MDPTWQQDGVSIYQGSCLDILPTLGPNSIDAIVTDPPAGIAFMGKDWDKDKGGRDAWIAWMSTVAAECLRILKPGAHALVWALPRTSHWTATAWENAGFEVRDRIAHVFGSGFPKGKNLGNGLGTTLKPAVEDWWLLRKPLTESTIAENVLSWGTGGINIDASRIACNDKTKFPAGIISDTEQVFGGGDGRYCNRARTPDSMPEGRWPANLVLSHTPECHYSAIRFEPMFDDDPRPIVVERWECAPDCPVYMLDKQSGQSTSTKAQRGTRGRHDVSSPSTERRKQNSNGVRGRTDSGGASRFFYIPKASREDRDEGLDGMPEALRQTHGDIGPCDNAKPNGQGPVSCRNTHPTVKPTELMRYLCRLVTPPGGVVLDPFMGSGSTGKAARLEGFDFIGIEQDAEYCEIARKRIEAAQVQMRLPI